MTAAPSMVGSGFHSVRLKCKEGDPGSLVIRSTLAPSVRLDRKTDERIDFTDSDLIVICNKRSDPCKVTLSEYTIKRGNGSKLVCQPSRQRTFVLAVDSEQEVDIILGGDETLVLRSDAWRASLR